MAALWALASRAEHRGPLLLALAVAAPLLLFAVVIFEPGSPERFLPGFPFFYLAFAGLLSAWPRQRVASLLTLLFLLGAALSNVLAAGRWRSTEAVAAVRQRRTVLEESIASRAQVFLLSLRDGLYALPNTRPLDHSLQAQRFRVVDVIETGSRRAERWREEFAARVRAAWGGGEEVWLSERLLSDRPAPAWQWVEGDDKRVRWAELPAFFRRLEYGRRAEASGDGFRRLAPSTTNRAWLERESRR